MKAMVLHAPKTPFVLEERPDPKPGRDEAVARVFACGAGLTIEHIRAGRVPFATFPRIIGHEISAEIVEVGPDVKSLKVGDPVTCYFYTGCGHCRYCLTQRIPLCLNPGPRIGYQVDGGYAEYIKMPEENFLKLPAGLDHRGRAAEVAVIADALATPFKVVRRAKIEPLETVAVVGAGGGLGIHMIKMARWAGARVIAVERSAKKFQACREAGAEAVVDAGGNDVVGAVMDATGGKGCDVVIDFVSSTQSLEAGFNYLGVAGRLVTLGGAGVDFTIAANKLLNKEACVMGSRYATKQEVLDTLALAASGAVWPLVTEIYPLAEAQKAHERVAAGEVIGRAALQIAS
ncbi:MAG TPA: zinc-binding dehydrogenase [Xanthobacteraceae bacterium]|nr:zinc-binding dehydrogenase [Xanthobacteraceae bacterium]